MTTYIVFLALVFIGIAVWGTKLNNINNESAEKIKKILLVNKDFQNELIKKIANPQYKEQILELIKDDLKYIYGDAWESLFLNKTWYIPNPCTTVFDTTENIILLLMLSKSGLMPDCYMFRGIEIRNSKAANLYEALKILHCVEKNIQKKKDSADYKFIFCPKISSSGYGKHMGPEIPMYDQPYMGSFHWAFESFYYNLKFTVRDIHNPALVTACKNSSIGERSEKEKHNPYKDKLTL